MKRDHVLTHNRRWRVIFWMTTLLIAAVIFGFSAQDRVASGELSGKVTERLVRIVYADFDSRPSADQAAIFQSASWLIRKSAHFIEYLLLGLSLRLLLATYAMRRPNIAAWLFGTLYAASDELHQWLGGTRAGMWQDVLLDSAGVLAGIGLACIILVCLAKRGAMRDAPFDG